jgi:hypothetical protein
VHPVDIPIEDAMRSVISCGAGSDALMKALHTATDRPKSTGEVTK